MVSNSNLWKLGDEKVDLGEKERKLLDLCKQKEPDLTEIKRTLVDVVDLNISIDEESNLLTELYQGFYYDEVQAPYAPAITQLFINAGFDTKRHGFNCLYSLRFSVYNQYAGETAKIILINGVEITASQWDELLESVGMEESYQSIEGDHRLANNNFAFYEILDRARKGLPFEDIQSWENCIGLRVDKVVASSSFRPVIDSSFSSEYRIPGELLLQCGEKTVLLLDRPNICIQDTKNIDYLLYTEEVTDLFADYVGKEITKVFFQHKKVTQGKTGYRQPNIFLVFSDDSMLHFYTNYGEVDDEETCILMKEAYYTEADKK